MQSDKVIVADQGNQCAGREKALNLMRRTAEYCGFDATGVSQIVRIAEEMISGCAAILDVFRGTLWAETEDGMFRVMLEMDGLFSQEQRDRFVSLTRESKNEFPKGFFARLGTILGDALGDGTMYPVELVPGIDNGVIQWDAAQIAQLMAYRARKEDLEDEALREEAKRELDAIVDDLKVSAHADKVLVIAMKRLPERGE